MCSKGKEMKIRMFAIAALIAAVLLGGLSEGVLAKGIKTRIPLGASTSYPSAKGKATYKVDGGEREFQVEVENIKKLAGKSLRVSVNSANVGAMQVNALGEARLNLNTDNGQQVPMIAPGARVQVKTAGGVLVVSGTF
jgi:hypothetical protein